MFCQDPCEHTPSSDHSEAMNCRSLENHATELLVSNKQENPTGLGYDVLWATSYHCVHGDVNPNPDKAHYFSISRLFPQTSCTSDVGFTAGVCKAGHIGMAKAGLSVIAWLLRTVMKPMLIFLRIHKWHF